MAWYSWPGRVLIHTMAYLLPNLEGASVGRWLVDGMYIPWHFVGMSFLGTLFVRSGLILLAACAVFRSRELARVQV